MSVAAVSPIVCESREEWLAERRNGIGASDAAAILGVSPFSSCYAVWAEKTGQINLPDSGNNHTRWGTLLEPIVRQEFARESGLSVHYEGPYTIHCHPGKQFIRATLDGLIGDDAIYEGKATCHFMGRVWTDEPPEHVLVQTQQQLYVTERVTAFVSVLIGGHDLRWYTVDRNDRFIDRVLVPRLEEFWDAVESRTAPETDGSAATTEAIKLLHPDDNGLTVTLDDDAIEKFDRFEEIKADIRQLECERDGIKNWIAAAIGDATFAVTSDGTTYSYKTQTRPAHQVKEATFRVLRRCKSK